MAKRPNRNSFSSLFAQHLDETEAQVDRLNECMKLLNAPTRSKPCKGMIGLLEEGDEVIAKHQKNPSGLDLALIGAGQKSSIMNRRNKTARDLAQQLGETAVCPPFADFAFRGGEC